MLILVVIAIPSFRLIYYQDRTPDPDMTIKVTGHQWYWEYTYPDQGNLDIESRYVHDEDLKPGQPRLLTVDNQQQADERIGGRHGHKGEEAAITAVKMISLLKTFKQPTAS